MPTPARSSGYRAPIAYFLTWTTYGSWLPGDARGWTDGRGVTRIPDASREGAAALRMAERPLSLDGWQRSIVHRVIRDHCQRRAWQLHAASCRLQHVHVALTAPEVAPAQCMAQFKAWTARRLAEDATHAGRKKWWTENGSRRLIFEESDLAEVVVYITECQDKPRP